MVRAHPKFMLFATQNPPGHYGGRKVWSSLNIVVQFVAHLSLILVVIEYLTIINTQFKGLEGAIFS